MATYHIEQRKLEGVQDIAARALLDKGFSSLDIILGLGEFIGRIAVMEGATPIQMMELLEAVTTHMVATTQIGAEAKGFSRPSDEELH
jgi:hypothetical protein